MTINPSFTSVFDLRKEICVLFGLISQALNSERRFCFLSSFGRQGTNFAAVPFMFKFSVKMGRHVSHYTHRILQTSLIVRCLPVWMTSRSSSTFSSAGLGIVDLNIQTLSRSLVTSETWILFKGICSTHLIITNGFFKEFHGSQKLVAYGCNKTR